MEENTLKLGKILSITGKPGLFKIIAQAKTGMIVESLLDGKRSKVFTHDKISALDEISVFTDSGEKPLREVFQQIQKRNPAQPAPDVKAESNELVGFFEEFLPDYDRQRLYVSHMRKICAWYNLLLEKELLYLLEESDTSSDKRAEEVAGT